MDGFPIDVETTAFGQVLAFRPSAGTDPVLVVAGADGYLHAFDRLRRGRAVPGFPLPVGGGAPVTPAVDASGVAVLSSRGDLRTWTFDEAAATIWRELYGSGRNASFLALYNQAHVTGHLAIVLQ